MQDEPLMQIELAATTAMRSCVGSPHMRRLVSVLDQRRPKSQNGRAIICLWMLCDLMQLVIILDERDCECLNLNGHGKTYNRHVACERVSMVSKQVWHNGGTDHFTYELAPCPLFLAGSPPCTLARAARKRSTKAAEAASIRSAARAAMYKLAAASAKLGLSKNGNGTTGPMVYAGSTIFRYNLLAKGAMTMFDFSRTKALKR